MGTVYVFFVGGFEEIEVFVSVDMMRRAGLKVEMIMVTPDETATGAYSVPALYSKNIVDCGFFGAGLVVLPNGMPGTATLGERDDLRRSIVHFTEENKPIAAICAAPMMFGKLGLLEGRKATRHPGLGNSLEGAEYTAATVERDGNTITGKGSDAATEFVLAVAKLLQGKDKVAELRKAMII